MLLSLLAAGLPLHVACRFSLVHLVQWSDCLIRSNRNRPEQRSQTDRKSSEFGRRQPAGLPTNELPSLRGSSIAVRRPKVTHTGSGGDRLERRPPSVALLPPSGRVLIAFEYIAASNRALPSTRRCCSDCCPSRPATAQFASTDPVRQTFKTPRSHFD